MCRENGDMIKGIAREGFPVRYLQKLKNVSVIASLICFSQIKRQVGLIATGLMMERVAWIWLGRSMDKRLFPDIELGKWVLKISLGRNDGIDSFLRNGGI